MRLQCFLFYCDESKLLQKNHRPDVPWHGSHKDEGFEGTCQKFKTAKPNWGLGKCRRKILWAAGLKDLTNVAPGNGYTGHAFNDWNHVDACTMLGNVQFEENNGRVEGMHYRNPLGRGIVIASDPTLGEGGTWSTCMVRKTHSLFQICSIYNFSISFY